ncbi:sodium/glucose cotransporter 2 [Iodidimonas gelatinilytica]|uniref:Sodium/glucose cotransporter 2 n=1 Tax=Iodidimonas gelatinilytica TaxID=1236966 RepID=A0A5A7MXI5_9PROT|nr:sodium:solute symporter [Iodidimonas gelatinilytica]GEQ99022.1 sodium/glucose cotransporter 2 [Iodidimonas gelatinilytica]GER00793.1 sodium/glucose cotransporter 2 [Iodidimonas gelatinilytica]
MELGISLHPIDIGLISAYFVIAIGLGIWFGRKHDTASDFFLAGRGMLWPVIGLSLFASNISSTTLVGLAGSAYSTGISVFNYEWMAAVVLVVFAVFFLPAILRAQVYTMPEFLSKRYDDRARTYFSLLTLFLNIVVDTAGGLFAGALLLQMMFPALDIWTTVTVLAIAAGIYTIAGGLAAVMFTDAIQAVLLVIGSVLITIFALEQVGGWDAVVAAVPQDKLSLIRPPGDPGVPWPGLVTGVFLLGFYFWCTNQFMVQRLLAAKNINHGRWGALFAGFLKLPVLFIMVVPGTIAILLYPDIEDPNLVYPTMLVDLLPVGIMGLVLAGFVAALMSQIDSTLNSASTLVTMDFVRRIWPQLNPHQLMRAGQISTFVFMLLAVLWAPQIAKFQSIFEYLQAVLAYTVPPIVAMFVFGVLWRRANASGGFAALVVGGLAGVVFFIGNQVLVDEPVISFLYVAPILFVISSITLVVVSLMTPPPLPEKTEGLLWTPATWHAESEDLAALPWWQNYRILSVGLLAVTAVIVISFW